MTLGPNITTAYVAESDPSAFKSRRVLLKRTIGEIKWEEIGEAMPFKILAAYRRVPITAERISSDLAGDGFTAANLGISAAVSVRFKGERYALVCHQVRDVRDGANQLISGYRQVGEAIDAAVLRELGEEVLIHDGANFRPLSLPTGQNLFQYQTIAYDGLSIIMEPSAIPAYAAAVDATRVPAIYFQTASHSAQAVMGFEIELCPGSPWSLAHCEELLNESVGVLETRIIPDGLRLARLGNDGLITGEIFSLQGGKLIPVQGQVTFSEVFHGSHMGVLPENSRPVLSAAVAV